MDTILIPFLQIIYALLSLYSTVIFIAIIFSWLVLFNILNTSNRVIFIVQDFLKRVTEPAFAFFRRLIPPFGSLDLSPIFLFVTLEFFQLVIVRVMMKFG